MFLLKMWRQTEFYDVVSACPEGKYGNSCEQTCSSGCVRVCDRYTATCSNCKPGLYREKCDAACPDANCSVSTLCLEVYCIICTCVCVLDRGTPWRAPTVSQEKKVDAFIYCEKNAFTKMWYVSIGLWKGGFYKTWFVFWRPVKRRLLQNLVFHVIGEWKEGFYKIWFVLKDL